MNGLADAELSALLDLRRYLSIVHHLPGRIRLRFGPALWGHAAPREQFRALLDGLPGIRDVRVNLAVASAVIEYDARQIPPDTWETLVHGDAEKAGALLNHWLTEHGQSLHDNLSLRSK